MRNFSKKLAFVLAAAMVFTAFAPAAKADAAEKEMAMNRATQTLYVNEGVNDKGAETLPEGLYGNVQEYDFYVKNKPADYAKEYNFLWESDNEKVATVDQKGLTKAVAVGTATITCTITDKATDDEVAVAEAKVTVKANAAAVVITNAEDYDTLPVPEDGVVDLNRMMFAEGDKEGTTKRGVKVTDYTRWIAEDADGKAVAATVVAIDQATGKFTFAADAPAGDYTLYCQTYQSDKYNQTTAESEEKVVVTVVDAKNEFEVEQESILALTLKFDKALDKLDKKDVKVEKVRERNGKDYFTKMTVKSVTLDKDVATVTLFNGMEDGNNYKVTVTDIEDSQTFTATVGKPDRIVVTAQVDGKDVDPLTTKVPATLNCKFYDANDVDVTAAGYNVTYSLVEYSKNGGYTLSGKELTIKKEGEFVGVKAKYQGYLENGKMTGEIVETFYFTAEDPDPIYAVDVSDFSLDGWPWYGAKKDLQLQDKNTYDLEIKVTTDDGKVYDNNGSGYKAGAKLPTSVGVDQTLSFTAVNPEICSVTSNGYLIPYKEGFAEFYANTVTPQQNGKPALVEPFASFVVEVKANSKFQSFSLDKYDVTVGVVHPYDDATIKANAIDQHGNGFDGAAKLNVQGVSENAKAILDTIKNNGGLTLPDDGGKTQKIVISGSEILDALNANEKYKVNSGDVAYLEFKAVIGTYEQYFNILVQNKGDEKDNYVAIGNNGTNGAMDALRVVDSDDSNENAENPKTLTFSAFEMSGNIKVNTKTFLEYPTDVANEAVKDQYYYKLTKDGQKVDHEFKGNEVSIALSGTSKAVSGSVIEGKDIVHYNGTGAGTYTFELYICYSKGELTLYDASTCVVTVGDKGAYGIMSQNENEVDMTDSNYHEIKSGTFSATDKAAIVACFTFYGRDGKKIEDMSKVTYDVKYDATEGTNSVFVESVHIYEAVDTDVYVEYVVPVNTVLVRK